MPRLNSRVACNSRPHPHPAPGAACSSRSSRSSQRPHFGFLGRWRGAGPRAPGSACGVGAARPLPAVPHGAAGPPTCTTSYSILSSARRLQERWRHRRRVPRRHVTPSGPAAGGGSVGGAGRREDPGSTLRWGASGSRSSSSLPSPYVLGNKQPTEGGIEMITGSMHVIGFPESWQ